MLIVTAAIIFNDKNEILIAQRKENSHNALKWEFPGGTVEQNESPEACLVREIKEELDLEIKIKDIFKVVYHKYLEKTVLLLFYHCMYSGGVLKNIDCNDARWIKIDELKNYDLADADKPAAEKLMIGS